MTVPLHRRSRLFGRAALLVALVVVLAPLALSAAFVETEKQAKTAALDAAGSSFITAEPGDDSQAYSDTPPAGTQAIRPNGTDGTVDTLLVVCPRLSTNTATCQIEVGLWSKRPTGGTYRFMGISDVQTATATLRTYGATFLPERPLYFPLLGATHYAIKVTDVSGSATTEVAAWTVGADSKAAE